jgi:hypothetical protein
MTFCHEWSTSIKFGVVVVASWIVPPLIARTYIGGELIGVLYIAFFFGILHLASEL